MKKIFCSVLFVQLSVIYTLYSCKGNQVTVSVDPVEEEVIQDKGGNFVPEGYTKIWEDHFDEATINSANWTSGTLRDLESGDIVPGADGDHLLKDKYSGYMTEEDSYIEDKALVLRNQKRSYKGTSPAGDYEYTSGWVMSMHKVHFNKGYIEMRAGKKYL